MSENRLREENIKRTLNRIQSIENAVHQPFYNLEQQQKFEVAIRVDNSVAHGLFKPDPQRVGGWIASEQTFRAMKKDIFALDEELLELAQSYVCESCKTKIDLQFWNFCPHCTASFTNK